MTSSDPVHRCLWTAAIVTLAVVAVAGAVAALSGDSRLVRPPVFMAILALAGGAGAFAGGWRGLAAAHTTEKPGLLLCAVAIASTAWTIGYLHVPSDDYRLREIAARQWLAGENLYDAEAHNQLPPSPIFLGAIHLALWRIAGGDPERLWQLTYYAHEVQQLLWTMAIIAGLYALAQAAGAPRERAGMLAGIAVALTFPISESLGNNQLNLPVLALALGALASVQRHPVLAGVFVAFAGASKLYPLVLLLEWVVSRRWRALISAAVTLAIIAVALWPHWLDFAAFVQRVEIADAYRHVGLHAIVMNTTRQLVALAGGECWRGLAFGVWLATILGVGIWAVSITAAESHKPLDQRRLPEVSARVMASVLLVFPLAWAHHFVFAVPLAVCLWARGWPRPRYVAGTALVLFVPAFDIYPLGLHRLAGLVLLLVP